MRTKEQPGDFEANQQKLFGGEDGNKGLSAREITFCYEYVANKGNGVAAAMAAGCKAKGPAGVRAHKWLKRAKIKKKIADITRDHFKGLKVKAEDVLNELAILGLSDMKEIVEWDENAKTTLHSSAELGDKTKAIREVEIEESYVPGTEKKVLTRNIKFKLHPKEKALELLHRYEKPDPDDNTKPNVNFNIQLDGKDIQDKNAAEQCRSYFELCKALARGQ